MFKISTSQVLALTVLTVFMSACSTKPRQGSPAPVISKSGYESTSSTTDGEVKISALTPPPKPAIDPATQTGSNKAVVLLQERAQEQIDNGDLAAAAKTLERAVSIDPRDARSWNLLAHLRARQKQYTMAVNIAAKSNSLAGENQKALKKDNLMLMADMKTRLGDTAQAEQYRRQAKAIN